jgi:hypothetical protein
MKKLTRECVVPIFRPGFPDSADETSFRENSDDGFFTTLGHDGGFRFPALLKLSSIAQTPPRLPSYPKNYTDDA